MRSCDALYGKTGSWRVKKVTAWFEKVLLPCFGGVKRADGYVAALPGERCKLRLTSLRDEWRRNLHRSPRKAGYGVRRSVEVAS